MQQSLNRNITRYETKTELRSSSVWLTWRFVLSFSQNYIRKISRKTVSVQKKPVNLSSTVSVELFVAWEAPSLITGTIDWKTMWTCDLRPCWWWWCSQPSLQLLGEEKVHPASTACWGSPAGSRHPCCCRSCWSPTWWSPAPPSPRRTPTCRSCSGGCGRNWQRSINIYSRYLVSPTTNTFSSVSWEPFRDNWVTWTSLHHSTAVNVQLLMILKKATHTKKKLVPQLCALCYF